MKTPTLLALLFVAGLVTACGGGSSRFYDPWDPWGGTIWLYKPGAPVGQIDIQNAPVRADGLPNERHVVRIRCDGQLVEGAAIAPGQTFSLPVDASVDHFLEFEFDDGRRAAFPDPQAPVRVEAGETTPIVVIY